MKKSALWIALAIAVDQITKYLIRANFQLHESRPVIDGLFNLSYVQNRGAAWGILAGWRIVLVLLAVIMLFFITKSRTKIFGPSTLGAISYILLFAGIVGNVIDRTVFGFVTDFLDFYINKSHFPSFNVADSCICVGVCLYMIVNIMMAAKEKEKK